MGGCLGMFAGGVLVVFMGVSGCQETMKADTPTEGNLKQFAHGATFNFFRQTPAAIADDAYDAGKSAVEGTGEFLDRIRERAEDDFGHSVQRQDQPEFTQPERPRDPRQFVIEPDPPK